MKYGLLNDKARSTEEIYFNHGVVIEVVGKMTHQSSRHVVYYLCKQHNHKGYGDACPLANENFESYCGRTRSDYVKTIQNEYAVINKDYITILEERNDVAKHVLVRFDD